MSIYAFVLINSNYEHFLFYFYTTLGVETALMFRCSLRKKIDSCSSQENGTKILKLWSYGSQPEQMHQKFDLFDGKSIIFQHFLV
ncbi:hypothetical protein BpHYR1_018675 [Brachionus plicatilis]|uniref:Uncharacterized protein n=1 Tax=Brachionus plicatilis TaxID=10195 RepID=A0A3M7T5P0_BRAPC|nr:hypothetical protein BpHYR1_018675 [Brachionus plicatilis]